MPNVYRATKRTGVQPSGIKDITNDPITSNGDHTIVDLENYEGVKINVDVGAAPNLQQKTVTAGVTAETFQPDTGYDGMSQVTVNPTPSQSKTVTAGTSQTTVTPDNDKLLSSVVIDPTPSTAITPSNASPVSLSSNTLYKPSASGYAISSYTTKSAPSSGYSTLSSGSIYKMSNTGYLYGSVQGGSLTPTTLWTNNNPTSNFSTQTVNLTSGSFSNYDYIQFYFRLSTTDSSEMSVIVPKAVWTNCTDADGKPKVVGYFRGSSSVYRFRTASYLSNTSCAFGNCLAVTTTANGYTIPTSIVGLK